MSHQGTFAGIYSRLPLTDLSPKHWSHFLYPDKGLQHPDTYADVAWLVFTGSIDFCCFCLAVVSYLAAVGCLSAAVSLL